MQVAENVQPKVKYCCLSSAKKLQYHKYCCK